MILTPVVTSDSGLGWPSKGWSSRSLRPECPPRSGGFLCGIDSWPCSAMWWSWSRVAIGRVDVHRGRGSSAGDTRGAVPGSIRSRPRREPTVSWLTGASRSARWPTFWRPLSLRGVVLPAAAVPPPPASGAERVLASARPIAPCSTCFGGSDVTGPIGPPHRHGPGRPLRWARTALSGRGGARRRRMVGEDLVCGPMEGLFLKAPDVEALHSRANRLAATEQTLSSWPMARWAMPSSWLRTAAGLAAILQTSSSASASPSDHAPSAPHHPRPRDDDARPRQRGRAMLALMSPFTRGGRGHHALPGHVAQGHRRQRWSPLSGRRRHQSTTAQDPGRAADRAGSHGRRAPEPTLLTTCDLVLLPAGASPPTALPPGVDVCWIRGAIPPR